jgi:hypothetical protein
VVLLFFLLYLHAPHFCLFVEFLLRARFLLGVLVFFVSVLIKYIKWANGGSINEL